MYTEINCAFELKKDTPKDVIDILEYMAGGKWNELTQSNGELVAEDAKWAPPPVPPLPDHEFFKCDRWESLFSCDSYYFAGESHSTVHFDGITECYHVTIRANLKNCCCEIDKFISWITPHIDAMGGDFIGYKRYEEAEIPTLIYYPNRFFTPAVPDEITEFQE